MKRVLTIAGSDSSGGRGHSGRPEGLHRPRGVRPFGCDGRDRAELRLGFTRLNTVPPRIVAAQIDAVGSGHRHRRLQDRDDDVLAAGSERGSRADRSAGISRCGAGPVIFAKNGERLLPFARGVPDAQVPAAGLRAGSLRTWPKPGELTGREVTDIASAKDAAKAMHDNGAANVLIKAVISKESR